MSSARRVRFADERSFEASLASVSDMELDTSQYRAEVRVLNGCSSPVTPILGKRSRAEVDDVAAEAAGSSPVVPACVASGLWGPSVSVSDPAPASPLLVERSPLPPLPTTRRRGGFITDIYVTTAFLVTMAWGLASCTVSSKDDEEIVGVETDSTGRKRRAVAVSAPSSASTTTTTTPVRRIPGAFPMTPALPTPPSSPSPKIHDLSFADIEASTPCAPRVANKPNVMIEPAPEPSPQGIHTPRHKVAGRINWKPTKFPSFGEWNYNRDNSAKYAKYPHMAPRELYYQTLHDKEVRAREVAERKLKFLLDRGREQAAEAQEQREQAERDETERQLKLNPPSRFTTFRTKFSQRFNQAKPKTLEEREHASDAKVDGIVARIRKVQLGTAESRKVQQQVKANYERKRAEAAEKLRKEQEAKQREIEREANEQLLREQQEEIELQYQATLAREAEQKARKEAQEAADLKTKQQLIRELDPKWKQKVTTALSVKNDRQVLAVGPDGNDLTRADFARIIPAGGARGTNAWLNDESINGWFSGMVAAKNEQTGFVKGPNSVPAIEAYNSGWLTTYKNKGIAGIKNWSKRKCIAGEKLLRAEKIFFPINSGSHWELLIISPKDRKLELLDSLDGSTRPWFKIAREWLTMELGNAYIPDEWTECDTQSSLQDNGYDCGVFTCINALASAKGRSFSDVRADNMTQARELMAAVLLNGGFKGDFKL